MLHKETTEQQPSCPVQSEDMRKNRVVGQQSQQAASFSTAKEDSCNRFSPLIFEERVEAVRSKTDKR